MIIAISIFTITISLLALVGRIIYLGSSKEDREWEAIILTTGVVIPMVITFERTDSFSMLALSILIPLLAFWNSTWVLMAVRYFKGLKYKSPHRATAK